MVLAPEPRTQGAVSHSTVLVAPSAPGPTSAPATSTYSVLLSTDAREVTAAQRLRHDVFATELGAHLVDAHDGLDVDRFDAFCDHLLVREERTGAIVGCYRVLPPAAAARAGGLYTGTEFDLRTLAPLLDRLVETGRSCVHPDHRSGAVMGLMWAGLLRYLVLSGNRWLLGCASVPLGDGGVLAAGVRTAVRARAWAGPEHRTTPLRPVLVDGVDLADVVVPDRPPLPALLAGYLRLGARVCGEPAWDPDFGVADFPVLLGLDDVDPRYARRLLGDKR